MLYDAAFYIFHVSSFNLGTCTASTTAWDATCWQSALGSGAGEVCFKMAQHALHTHVCRVCIYVCMYVCMCICVCMYVCVYICVYICVYVCVYICLCACVSLTYARVRACASMNDVCTPCHDPRRSCCFKTFAAAATAQNIPGAHVLPT